jgi:hypothetical protein
MYPRFLVDRRDTNGRQNEDSGEVSVLWEVLKVDTSILCSFRRPGACIVVSCSTGTFISPDVLEKHSLFPEVPLILLPKTPSLAYKALCFS